MSCAKFRSVSKSCRAASGPNWHAEVQRRFTRTPSEERLPWGKRSDLHLLNLPGVRPPTAPHRQSRARRYKTACQPKTANISCTWIHHHPTPSATERKERLKERKLDRALQNSGLKSRELSTPQAARSGSCTQGTCPYDDSLQNLLQPTKSRFTKKFN